FRNKGSAGGHNGLKSIIDHLGTNEFSRLRIGVGPRPEESEMVNYVLDTFRPEEFELFEKALCDASEVVEAWISGGYDRAYTIISMIKTNKN
ncbi:aminoacyl-tRNA hydrolase, partial [Candidatus Latescibacterota bacterium]